MTAGSPFIPVKALTACRSADSSATMYRNMVISLLLQL
jgi:hypothetical protein